MSTPPDTTKHYHVSGLDYTMPKMLATMGIIIVGHFAYSMCMGVVPNIVPLKLKELGISSTLLVFIMSTLGQILNMTVCPWVSFKSDRYRSKRWGRRVPFILYTLPFLCLSWIVVGCYETEAAWLGKLMSCLASFSQTALAIFVLAAGVVLFKFFYMFVGSVIHYIYYDVIPPQFLTRFNGAIMIEASFSSAIFNFFVFKHALTHFRIIFICVAVFYALLMGFMCFMLKEPHFPDPAPGEQKKNKGIGSVILFCKESFCHRIYWYNCIHTTFIGAAAAANIFLVFQKQSMGLDLAAIGNVNGISGLIGTCFTFVVASIGAAFIDKWHPVRTSVFLSAFTGLNYAYGCKWFFFTPPVAAYWWASLLLTQANFMSRFTGIAGMPLLMKTLPKSRFGQFCSARSLLSSLLGIFFALLLGVIMDFLKVKLHLGDLAYRAIYFWQLFFFAIGTVFYFLMFREYKKLGGYNGYKAPAIWEKSGYEQMEISKAQSVNPKILSLLLFAMDGVFVLSVICVTVLGVRAGMLKAVSEEKLFFSGALPLSILVFAFWLFVHKLISARIRKYNAGELVALPHHGLMFLIVLMRLCLTAVIAVQAWLTLKIDSGTVAASITTFDIAVDFVIVGLILIYTRMEIPEQKADSIA